MVWFVNYTQNYICKKRKQNAKINKCNNHARPSSVTHFGEIEIWVEEWEELDKKDRTCDSKSWEVCFKGKGYKNTIKKCKYCWKNCLQHI